MTTLTLIYFYNLLFSFSLAKLWPSYCVFVKTLANTSLEFGILFFFIVVSLLANSLGHLIYKVLNLGVLSILVAATWAYVTDLSFVYVVYVLAFVGAVVMLFLSVILMLPSSAVAVAKRINCSSLLLLVLADINFDFFLIIANYFFTLLVLFSASMFVLYIVAGLQLKKLKASFKLHEDRPLLKAYVALPSGGADTDKFNIKDYSTNYDFYVYEKESDNDSAIAEINGVNRFYHLPKAALTVISKTSNADSLTSLFVVAVPKGLFYKSSSEPLRLIGAIISEFLEYYFLVIENHYLRRVVSLPVSIGVFGSIRGLVSGLRSSRNYTGDLRNLVTFNKKRFPIKTRDSLTARTTIIYTYTPWWSPFNVLAGTSRDGNAALNLDGRGVLVTLGTMLIKAGSRLFDKLIAASYNTRMLYSTSPSRLADIYILGYERWLLEERIVFFIHSVQLCMFEGIDLRLLAKSPDYMSTALLVKPPFRFLDKFYPPLLQSTGDNGPLSKLAETRHYKSANLNSGFMRNCFSTAQYRGVIGTYKLQSSQFYNRALFILNIALLVTINCSLHFARIFWTSVKKFGVISLDLVSQTTSELSSFLLCVPLSSYTYEIGPAALSTNIGTTVESLGAIQYILYVSNPLLMLVSVTGLLVALIGAATIHKIK